MKGPEVQAYLAARRVELRETKRTAAERVIDEVSAVAFANLAEFGAYELHGPEDLLALPKNLQRLVKGWKWDRHSNFVLQFERTGPGRGSSS